MRDDRDQPLRGGVLLAELDGRPLTIVAVNGAALRADPVGRAQHAVRFLLLYSGRVISDTTPGAKAHAAIVRDI